MFRFELPVRFRLLARAAAVLALTALAAVAPVVADGSTVSGRVTAPGGGSVEGTVVRIIELNYSRTVQSDGAFRFDDVPSGEIHLVAENRQLGSRVVEVTVDGDLEVDLELDRSVHRESIVVSAGRARGENEIYTPIDVLDSAELQDRMQPTLGETLANEPGVHSTYFGPGSSRPIIRGQGGGRIRVLEGGLDVGDASSSSPDHAVAIDPLFADRVEILRGPATLLYGSTAVGGAVNVIDHRVPESVPAGNVEGALTLRYGSAAEDRTGAIDVDAGFGSFAFHVDALKRETEDYEIPGRAVEGEPDSSEGTLDNSAIESEGGTFGASWVGEHAFAGVSIREYDTLYGIPAELEAEEGEEHGAISIDLDQRRYDVRGGAHFHSGPFSQLRVNYGRTDYEHVELEGTEVGTRFLNESDELRAELQHGRTGDWKGVLGAQLTKRDFEAIGAEAFVPPSETTTIALFALEEIERGDLRFELGARYERQDTEADSDAFGVLEADFDGISASASIAWEFSDGYDVGASVMRSSRAPTAEELFSNGPHLATFSFEVGDPGLDVETGLGLDVWFRKRAGRLTTEIHLFGTDYGDYIYEAFNGSCFDEEREENGLDPIVDCTSGAIEGLPVFEFRQDDARFYGFEAEGTAELYHDDDRGHDLDLTVRVDRTRAALTDLDEWLPRIPALRYGTELRYRGSRWSASLGATRTEEQDAVAPGETTTDGYTLVDASVGYRFSTAGVVHELMLQGRNLTDEEARPHTSRLKAFTPLPGTDVRFVYRLLF